MGCDFGVKVLSSFRKRKKNRKIHRKDKHICKRLYMWAVWLKEISVMLVFMEIKQGLEEVDGTELGECRNILPVER